MVERLRGRSIFELQISQETCAILGPPVTPVLLETLAATTSRVLRTEIARALGVVRDPRAVDALLELVRDRASFLRAVAAESLGAYLDHDPRVEPVLVALLDDREAAPRVAALSALVTASPSATLARKLADRPPEVYRTRFGADDRDYRMAWTTAMLAVAGQDEHWPAVKAWLTDEQRYVRRASWDLLRRALRLPFSLYDGNVDPTAPEWVPLDEERVLGALRARRTVR
jgi:HEAT repeat protein